MSGGYTLENVPKFRAKNSRNFRNFFFGFFCLAHLISPVTGGKLPNFHIHCVTESLLSPVNEDLGV